MRVLLKNCIIADGSGQKLYLGDILIVDEKIADLKKGGFEYAVRHDKKIDLKKKYVAMPGFIDIHSHSDLSFIDNPYYESKLCQGITTEVVGNCGFSPFPVGAKNKEKFLERNKNCPMLTSFSEYKRLVNKTKPSVNICALVGYGTIRSYYIGYSKIDAKSYYRRISRKIIQCLSEGCFGVSLGLMYPPCMFMDKDEISNVFKSVKKFDSLVSVHLRDEGDYLLESLKEILTANYGINAKIQISHFKVAGKSNWGKLDKAFSIIESAKKEGMIVNADRYPYEAFWTDLDAVLPKFVFEKGKKGEMEWLGKKRDILKERFLSELRDSIEEYFSSIVIVQSKSRKFLPFLGKSLLEIAKEINIHPFDVMCDVLMDSDLKSTAIFFAMSLENTERILLKDYVCIGTDSSAKKYDLKNGYPHPRSFGSFPRFFEKFVKSGKVSVEEGVRKCSGFSAEILGLRGRGLLKKEYFADIVVLDLSAIKDNANYMYPYKKPSGIEYVFVNGGMAFCKGEINKRRYGNVLLWKKG